MHVVFPLETNMSNPAISPADRVLMDRVVTIIHQFIDDPDFGVNQLAHSVGVARTKLYTKVCTITGQTPKELIMQHRLSMAAYMLIHNPELNITEIADCVGFGSSKYFTRIFKGYYHMTPRAYRRGDDA